MDRNSRNQEPQGIRDAAGYTGVESGVTLVNTGWSRQDRQQLVMEGDLVACISEGETHDQRGTQGQRYAGAFVMPGLIDMHDHYPVNEPELGGLLFLLRGVGMRRFLSPHQADADQGRD